MGSDVKAFTFFRSYYEALQELKPSERHAVYDAIMSYVFEDVEPQLRSSAQRIAFTLIQPTLDSNVDSRASGRRGGRPSNSVTAKDSAEKKGGFENPKRVLSEKEKGGCKTNKDKDKDMNKDMDKESIGGKKFAPPTIEQVKEYIKSKGLDVPAEKWWHYYNARDWNLSKGQKMKNWKSAVHTWDRRSDGEKITDFGGGSGNTYKAPGGASCSNSGGAETQGARKHIPTVEELMAKEKRAEADERVV